jgi:DNA-binding response OmpR family regulator
MLLFVIDDEPLVRKAIKRVGEDKGFKVITAEDGNQAVEIWRDSKPDIVFLDVLMPGLTGPQVLAEVKKSEDTFIVLMSAFTGDYDMKKAKEIGADLFIEKPFKNIFSVFTEVTKLANQKKLK